MFYVLHILLKHVLTNIFINQRTTDRNEQWITVLEFDIPEHPFNIKESLVLSPVIISDCMYLLRKIDSFE